MFEQYKMNFDKSELKNYEVAGFKAYELYPYFTQKTKRTFRGYRQDLGNETFRIVVYPHSLVNIQQMIAQLKFCKQKHHKMLGKIKYIYQQTFLSKVNDKANVEPVIAVVIEDRLDTDYISLYQFLTEVNRFTENLSKQFLFQTLNFIQQMAVQGINQCFSPHDILIDRITGSLRIDNYGDRKHFKVKQNFISNCWEIGTFLYTCLKGMPPYNTRSQSDPYYISLKQNDFAKFWTLSRQKLNSQLQNFINLCFRETTGIKDLKNSTYLINYQQISVQQTKQEISTVKSQKQTQYAQAVQRRKSRKQKIRQCIQQRNQMGVYRNGTVKQKQKIIQQFLLKLDYQDDHPRKLPSIIDQKSIQDQQEINVQTALFILLLENNDNEEFTISEIIDHKTSVEFKVSANLYDSIEINSQVSIDLYSGKQGLQFQIREIKGSFYECLWVENHVSNLLQQI